tara:strand:- start:19447 stop:19929 length:483 start_codon:yes stop_codon:yes gene_type:complete
MLALRLERQKAKLERLEQERQLQEQQAIENEQREMAEAEQERLHLRCELEETKRLQLKWEEVTRRVFGGVEVERQQAGRGYAGGADKPADDPGLNIPRCTWLGFRDGDGGDVVLARLAVHDREPIPATGAEPAWAAGFVLFNAAESDIESWASLITAMES